jgi:hypothetical protein
MEKRIVLIEQQLRNQKIYSFTLTTLLVLIALLSFTTKKETDVIRTKGIVIVDSLGRERIIIGTPIPYTASRVRTNMDKAVKAWGKDGEQSFKSWYSKLDHSVNGIVMLDEEGFDRLAIGQTVPDPSIGKRIGVATGIMINDQNGDERTGYALLHVKGQNRVNIGFDRKDGTEGVVMGVLEDGTAGVYASSKEKSLFLGNAPKKGFVTGTGKPHFGLIIRDTSKVKYAFNSEPK